MDGLTMHRWHFAFTDGPQSPAMYYTVLGILVLSLFGTGFSLYSWFKHSTLHDWRKTEQLSRNVLNDPNLSSETTSAALFPVLIPLPQLCLDSAWQNSLIKSERFVQQARHTLTDAR